MTEQQRKEIARTSFSNGLEVVAYGLFAESKTMLCHLYHNRINIRQLYIDPTEGIRVGYSACGDASLEYPAAEALEKLSEAEIGILFRLGR